MARPILRRRAYLILVISAAPLLMGSLGLTSNLEVRLLGAHNRERASAGVPALSWRSDLAASAKQWADHLARTGRFEHFDGEAQASGPEGENLWAGTRSAYSAEEMIGLWVDEKKHFKPGVFPENSTTGSIADVGHYTQVMWRSSASVGCALSSGRMEDILVCRYSDAGNVRGQQPF